MHPYVTRTHTPMHKINIDNSATHMHTCIHAYMHTCYMHTCIHAYTRADNRILWNGVQLLACACACHSYADNEQGRTHAERGLFA